MKRLCVCISIFLLVISPSFSAEGEVFAPFVSRLKVVPEGPRVKITWNDSDDIQGRYIIYRHTEEISEENFRLAEAAGWVPSGKGFFIDSPPEYGKPYYYAVLAESDQGELYELFIPFRNKTVYAISVEEEETLENLAASVTTIRTEAGDDFILLRYDADKKGRELSVYRSITPIRDSDDVLDADLVALVSSSDSEYRDFSIPGIPYYYGIIDSEQAKAGNYVFTAGRNATTEGTQIALSSGTSVIDEPFRSRARPLPFLTINSTFTTGEALAVSPLPSRATAPLSGDVQTIVQRITRHVGTGPEAPSEPDILETDRIRLSNSESYSLGRILETSVLEKKWSEGEQRLLSFQKTRHSDTEDVRSHYYLGQVYYFQGKYREAFFEFLMSREVFVQEADSWLDHVFKALQ